YRIRQEFDKGAPLEKTLISCTVHIRRALDKPERRSVEIILDGEQLVAGEKFQPSDNCLKAPLVISDRKRGELRVYSYATGRKQAPLERDLVEQTGAILSSFIQNRELQEKLVQTEKLAAGGRVAAGVAHEINNPLGAIKNSLYILKKAISPHHEDYSYLELMETEISRVAGIITQLYDLYKPASQKPQLVELEKVVGNVLKIMEGKINRRKITVVNRLDSAVPRLNTSVNQLTQVLYNIIENAVQAIGEGGMLTIAAEKSPGRLELSISDTGPGIPDDVLPKIFEPFFTTKGVSKVSGEGMGLGLSLSRTIMESLGGGIALRTKQGAGTTFLLDFPTR
ncbi:MAG: ATP-binding protein, partial [Gemmatimonadota bacterium]|nr:ATP-binding protein [Gemmatimonadota bacterium]